jgi:acyl-CoA thioesterase FadM
MAAACFGFAALSDASTAPRLLRASSLIQPIFIEDTDAYGVVYHNNYAKIVHRALQRHYAASVCVLSDALPARALPVELIGLDQFRFLRPAVLGDEVVITSNLVVDEGSAGRCIIMDHEMVSAQDGLPFATARSASRARGVHAEADRPEWAIIRDGSPNRASVYDVDVWEDELTPGGLSPSAVLRAFERARTDTLGGPAALSRLQRESVKCLVARMDAMAFGTHLQTGLPGVVLGQPDLCVLSSTSVRKARICFDQSLVARGTGGTVAYTVLARGLVTCLCVDGVSGKMRSPPPWITSRFDAEQEQEQDLK